MINEKEAKTILRKKKKIDSWFLTHYGLNLYRGCMHNCTYCDGRAEAYRVEGDFGNDIEIKTNAIQILEHELNPARKRKPMPKSFVMLGGGVTDSYQPIEKKYELARQTLELLIKYKYPVHILTKSSLVERDIDLLKIINQQTKALVSFSFSSASDNISKLFEPRASLPSERLATIRKLKRAGISAGMFIMPVIPFITDLPKIMGNTLQKGKEAGADFAIFGTMTLKPERQKQYFINHLIKYFPDLQSSYEIIYANNSQWGEPHADYNISAHQLFSQLATRHKIPKRIPPHIYRNIISKTDLVIVTLQHLDYILKFRNAKNPYGYAAYKISELPNPIETYSKRELNGINGIGTVTGRIIEEIVRTGKYSKLNLF